MSYRIDRLITGSSLLLLLVAVAASQAAGDVAKLLPILTTAVPLPAAGAKSPPVTVTTKPEIAPAVAKLVTSVPALAALAAPIITIKPGHVKPVTDAPVAPHVGSAVLATAAPAADGGPGKKLAQYFEPLCTSLDKLNNEHMLKVQGQMKSFVEKTNGKMTFCFMQHYTMDPSLTPVSIAQLKTICSSQTLAADNKNSFKSFQACAANNWDKNLDTELDRIIKLRLNCFFNHTHSKNDPTVSLVHENEEMSIINEVVSKALSDNKMALNNNSMTMINLGPAAKPAAPASAAAASNTGAPLVGAPNQPADSKKLLNDPNTVLVIVNDSANAKTGAPPPPPAIPGVLPPPPPPAHVPPPPPPASKAPAAPAPASTHKPNAGPATTAKTLSTALGEKILAAITTGAPKPPATTTHPKTNVSSMVSSVKDKLASGIALATTKPAGTTSKPTTGHPATTAASGTTKQPGSTAKPGPSTSKPKTTPAAGSTSAPEKDKDKDKNIVKDAIKSLQVQRAGHASDAKLHQLEHERQMAIDPEGHTDKHRKYEQLKQQRTSKAPASSTKAPTTKASSTKAPASTAPTTKAPTTKAAAASTTAPTTKTPATTATPTTKKA